MRLAFVYSSGSFTNAQYRALMPMEILRQRGHEIAWFGSTSDKFPVNRIRHCDLVHVYRAADSSLLKSLYTLQDNGVAISWDNDDDVVSLSEHSPNYSHLGDLKGLQDFHRQTRALRLADVVTTTSHALAAKFIAAGAHHVVRIENYLPPEFARNNAPRTRNNGVVIGWAALREHEADLKLLSLRGVLEDVLEKHSTVRLVSLGLNLGIEHDRYALRERLPFDRLASTLQEFDIGLAPIADIPFNRARSNIKLKEYAIAGVPWLASPVGEYLGFGARQGGQLVKDDEWPQALSSLIRGRAKKAALRTRGRIWARGQTIDLHAHLWESVFENAIAQVKNGRRQ